MHNLKTPLAALAATTLLSLPAAAAQLEVQLTGLDVYFGQDGERNLQSGPVAGDVDELAGATFLVDGVEVGSVVGGVSANIGIPGFDIPVAGGTDLNRYQDGYFALDFDTTDLGQGYLNLDVDDAFSVEATYAGGQLGLSIVGTNSGLLDQQPVGRIGEANWQGFDAFEEIRFTFVSTALADMQDDGAILTRFHATGTGSLDQVSLVPEPATAGLLATAGLVSLRRRRR